MENCQFLQRSLTEKQKLHCCIAHRSKLNLWYLISLQEMHQIGILPRNKSTLSPVSTSPEETIAAMAALWDEFSAQVCALQVLSAMVTPQHQII